MDLEGRHASLLAQHVERLVDVHVPFASLRIDPDVFRVAPARKLTLYRLRRHVAHRDGLQAAALGVAGRNTDRAVVHIQVSPLDRHGFCHAHAAGEHEQNQIGNDLVVAGLHRLNKALQFRIARENHLSGCQH